MKLLTTNIILAAALTACIPHPDTQTPKANNGINIPKRFDATSPPVPEITTSLLNIFPDSNLRQYINKAKSNNPDLKVAAARLEEAGYNTRQTQAELSPSLTANTTAARNQSNSSGSGTSFGSIILERYTASLDAQWEVDLWGRIRSGISASALTRDALRADYAAARQSIAAQTAQAYFELVASQKLQELAARRLQSFKKTLTLVTRRFESGTGNIGDVELARTDLETARSTLAQRQDTRDQAARRLATLTGAYPNKKLTASTWPKLIRSVRSGIPSTLLMNRPDIDAAYQRIRAADANVTAAHRNLYPSFSLTASAGRQSATLRDLADSNFSVWSILGNLSAPLINGGSLRSEIGASNARAKQALADYQSIVLNAFNEVEDALGSEHYLLLQEQATDQSLKSAIRAENQILRSYERGTVEILTLLDTQRRRFTAEETLINIKNLRYQNRVSLALALGKAY